MAKLRLVVSSQDYNSYFSVYLTTISILKLETMFAYLGLFILASL